MAIKLKNNFSHISEPYRSAHKACSQNKEAVRKSKLCGCFYCLNVYPSTDVIKWIEENDGNFTAECPKCGIDSVIPDASGIPLNAELLAAMKKWWF